MLLELNNLKKSFSVTSQSWHKSAQVVRAIDDVNLSIREGENLGLVGESGSGKTTLARCLIKLYSPDSGEITFNKVKISHLSQRRFRPYRSQVQMVFQDPYSSLDGRYSIEGILKESFHLQQGMTQMAPRERMEEVLHAVDLSSDMLSRFPHELSGGERQRIAIARALIMNPKLLILDEAVSSLDVIVQQQILDLLNRLQQEYNMTYLFISHNLRVIRKICHRVAVMLRGKIVEIGPKEEIFHNPLHPYTRQLLAAAINYQCKDADISLDGFGHMVLVEKGQNHYVLEKKL